MRNDIKMLCVTNWNAVLELRTQPYYWVTEYLYQYCPMKEITIKHFNNLLTVADPDAIDAGQVLHIGEIKLAVRLKSWKSTTISQTIKT